MNKGESDGRGPATSGRGIYKNGEEETLEHERRGSGSRSPYERHEYTRTKESLEHSDGVGEVSRRDQVTLSRKPKSLLVHQEEDK